MGYVQSNAAIAAIAPVKQRAPLETKFPLAALGCVCVAIGLVKALEVVGIVVPVAVPVPVDRAVLVVLFPDWKSI